MKTLEQLADDEMSTYVEAGNSQNAINKEIDRLSKLSLFEYEAIRNTAAKKLDFRVSALDEAVRERRSVVSSSEKGDIFKEVNPWHEPVDAEKLLDEIVYVVHKFIICDRETAIATA